MNIATGNCYWNALQLVQDYSTKHDKIPSYFSDHDLPFNYEGFGEIQLVHGRLSTLPIHNNKHAWVEIGEWVIDYANKSEIIRNIDTYYNDFGVTESTSVGRELSFAICRSKPDSPYWGDYSPEWFLEIENEFRNPDTPWKRIDYLTAQKENRNPFDTL